MRFNDRVGHELTTLNGVMGLFLSVGLLAHSFFTHSLYMVALSLSSSDKNIYTAMILIRLETNSKTTPMFSLHINWHCKIVHNFTGITSISLQ